MEVTETNSILNMVMTGRVSAQVAASPDIGEDFAALLSRPNFAPEHKNAVVPDAETAIRASQTETRQTKKAAEKTAGDSREDRTARRKNETDKARDDDAVSRDRKVRPENSNENVAEKKSGNREETRPVDEKMTETSGKNGESKVPVQNAPEAEGASESQSDGNGENAQVVLSAEMLALLGNLLFLNPQNGEWVQTTGAELAASISASKENVPLVMSLGGQYGEGVNVIALDEGKRMAVENGLLGKDAALSEGFVSVADGEVFDAALPENIKNLTEDMLPEAEVETAAKTAKMSLAANDEALSGKKIKIQVNVSEEKTATGSSDLLADVAVVDEAVRKSETVAGNKPETVKTANPEPFVNPVATGTQTAAGVVQPVAAAGRQTGGEASVRTIAAAAADTGTGHASQAVVSGSEFVASSKINTAAEDAKTSFKDIYKGMSREVVDQVKVNITKSAVKGIDKIDVHLKPQDLGNIEIKMQLSKDGKLQAHIISSRPETMEILQKEIQTLERAFNDAGFQTDEGSLSFSFRDNGSAAGERQQNDALRNFIGDVLSQEADNDSAAEIYSLESWNGKTGLNIRV